MQLSLSKTGTVTECREALNGAIAALPTPHREANAVVRAAAHYIVDENLDPLQKKWQQAKSNAAAVRASGGKAVDPLEPQTAFSISLTITVDELKEKEGDGTEE